MLRYFPNNYEDFGQTTALSIVEVDVNNCIQNHIERIMKRMPPIHTNIDGGLYVGVSGISFMFYNLAKSTTVSSDRKQFYLKKSLEYIRPALEVASLNTKDKTSFLLGDAGTYAIATALYKELGDEKYNQMLHMYKTLYNAYLDPKFLKCGGDELFVGRAGYLAGLLWLSRDLTATIMPHEDIYRICEVIVASGRNYSKTHRSISPLMYAYYKTEYLGSAHGISFILQILISVPGYMDFNKAAAKDIKVSIDCLLSLQTSEGNWPCCMEEVGMKEHKLVHWCHGAPGIVYLMAKAYLVFKEQKYYDSCIKSAELVWQKGLLRKGPGLCHGVAGSGYVFLLLYRLTRDTRYLYRALMFANFMNTPEFQQEANIPDNPYSLYEGTAGTVCFLADLLSPDKAEFPFQDVFTSHI